MPTAADTDKQKTVHIWNTSKLTMPRHAIFLKEYMVQDDPNMRMLFEKGYIVDRRMVCTESVLHAIDISQGMVDTYDMDDPSPTSYTQNATAVAYHAAKAAAAAAASPAAAYPPVVMPTELDRRFQDAPEVLGSEA